MTDLPSGTVTFLFTDVEGSTRLLQELGRDRYTDALAAHERILRGAFEGAGGREIDTQGDAFFVAFASAGDAVAAAEAAQRGLAEYVWPEGRNVRVRMGIHTGEPARGETRYVGLGVHKGARICSAGHGGQVLVSHVTHDLLVDEGIAVAFKDLGEQRLKDLERPENVYQLVLDGLPNDFPPLRTVEPTPFAGREGELAQEAAAAVAPFRRRRRRELLAGALMGVVAAAVAIPIFAFGGGDKHGQTSSTVAADSVLVIDPRTNKAVADVPVGDNPGSMAYGAGAVWVANTGDKTITRIDPNTFEKTTFGVPLTPTGIAVGDGVVWVGGIEGSSDHPTGATDVLRIVAGSRDVVDTIRIAPRSDLFGVYVALGGDALWVTNRAGPELVEVDPAKDRVRRRIPNIDPSGVVFYDGSVWVSDRSGSEVVRLNPQTLTRTDIPLGSPPSAIAPGGDAVWVAAGRSEIWKIVPATNSVDRSVQIGPSPNGIAGDDNSVWVTRGGDIFTSPAVLRVDLKMLDVTATDVSLGGGGESHVVPRGPGDILVAAGRVWVAIQ
jgi:YVTN family beta-propeller protein